MIFEAARAKLNLALHVTGRREDGYHLLDSLVAFADIGDRIALMPGPLSLKIDGPFADDLSAGNNLCLDAARLAGGAAQITLTKILPVASGVGGGSADAAAVLRGLARMGHPMPADPWRLGADVPVCIASVPARMAGIGEKVTPLPALPPVPLVLVNPGCPVATPQVFSALTCRENSPLPPIPAFADRAALIGWLRGTRNDLETPARTIAPVIGTVLRTLDATGAAFTRMSGSGATCFGLFDSVARARASVETLKQHGWWAVVSELAPRPAPG